MKSRRSTKRRHDSDELGRNEKNGLTETEKETKASFQKNLKEMTMAGEPKTTIYIGIRW